MKCTKAVTLISSGIDSPVASWLMLKRGVDLIGIHCSNVPLASDRSIDITMKMCKQIGINRLYIIKHGEIFQKRLVDHCRPAFICVLCKRFMYRVAEAIAKKEGASCIVTGDNLGQVASQTLNNMVVLSRAISLPILRPLLCDDKQEIIDMAKDIGTYEIGLDSLPSCTIVPKSPSTNAAMVQVEIDEGKFDIPGLVKEAVETAKIIDL